MKKTWIDASIESLDLNQTAYDWIGSKKDGGYIGDGILSGHQVKPTCPTQPGTGSNTDPIGS